jgi:hypothetical protein
MNFSQNPKAFLKTLPLKKMSGQQKLLALAALHCRGKTDVKVSIRELHDGWRKSVLGVAYNPALYDRAQQAGWLDPVAGEKGVCTVTETGLDHLKALVPLGAEVSAGELKQAGALVVVNRKATHTFDKFLRNILAEAKREVLIADSWVDHTLFDGMLDVIPKTVPMKLIYSKAQGDFDRRMKRFSTEYQKVAGRRYKPLHDRFLVVDDVGYVLGPSIKDAASLSPALVVMLGDKETRLLRSFFAELWSKGKSK